METYLPLIQKLSDGILWRQIKPNVSACQSGWRALGVGIPLLRSANPDNPQLVPKECADYKLLPNSQISQVVKDFPGERSESSVRYTSDITYFLNGISTDLETS